VNVFDLLPHHFIRLNLLRMAAILPELVLLIYFVTGLEKLQFLQQCLVAFVFHLPENCCGNKRFELTHTFGKLRPDRNPMDMIFHDDKRQNVNFSLALKKLPTVQYDFRKVGLGEYGQPCHNGVCHEVRVSVISESVAGAWHGGDSGGKMRSVNGDHGRGGGASGTVRPRAEPVDEGLSEMSAEKFDVIVMGCGGFGSAAIYHLARGGLKVMGIDRFHPPHDLGSSHGETRIIRKAYFEHPNYVPLLHRAWDLWEALAEESNHKLIERRDLLMAGPPGSEVIEGARRSARLHNLPLEDLTRSEACKRFPMFNLPLDHEATVESTAGFLRVEDCVGAHLDLAQACGAQLRFGETVQTISGTPRQLSIQTDRATYSAAAGVLTCGAWTSQLLPDYARLITVRRKTLFWYPIQSAVWADRAGAPIYFLDLPEGQFYGLPSIDGRTIKTGEHTGGETVENPSALERSIFPEDERPVSRFVSERLVDIESKSCRSAVCMYSMSPDGHFLFDQLSDLPLVVGAGFSGHGFKFASVLGEAAAELIQQGRTSLDIDFLSMNRFAKNTG